MHGFFKFHHVTKHFFDNVTCFAKRQGGPELYPWSEVIPFNGIVK